MASSGRYACSPLAIEPGDSGTPFNSVLPAASVVSEASGAEPPTSAMNSVIPAALTVSALAVPSESTVPPKVTSLPTSVVPAPSTTAPL